MRLGRIPFLLLLTVTLGLAGCFGDGEAARPESAAPASAEAAAVPAIDAPPVEAVPSAAHAGHPITNVLPTILEATDCREGGGHSLYPTEQQGEKFLDVWTRADAKPRLGNPAFGSYGTPLVGAATGIYHATVTCKSYTFQGQERTNLVWGYIVTQVEAPPFDTGGADVHFLASQILINDPDVADRVMQDSGMHAMPGGGVVEFGNAGPNVLRTTYDGGDMHGVFETHVPVTESKVVDREVVRIWYLHYAADKLFHPLAIDFTTLGAKHHVATGGTSGVMTHTNTQMHGPVPAAGGNVAGLFLDGFSRTFEWGPRPSVATTQVWEH